MAKRLQDANAVATKWANNLSAAGDSIRAGVGAVTQAPGVAAAARKDQYLAGVQRSVQKWADNVSAVSLGDWKTAMIDKGLPRIATGAQSGKRKFANFLQLFFNYLANLQQVLDANPRGGLEANIARMTATVRFLAQFKQNPGM